MHYCYPILLELTTFHLPATFKQQQTCAMLFKMSSVLKFKTSHKNLLKNFYLKSTLYLINSLLFGWIIYMRSQEWAAQFNSISQISMSDCVHFSRQAMERERKNTAITAYCCGVFLTNIGCLDLREAIKCAIL